MTHDQMVRNMKDFADQYLRATDYCFQKCITNFNKRSLTNDENICIRSCGLKTIHASQRNIMEYQVILPKIMERTIKETEERMLAKQKAKEAEEFQKFAEKEMAKEKQSLS